MIKSNKRGGARPGSGRKPMEATEKKIQISGSIYLSEQEILSRYENIFEAKKAINQAIRKLFE